MDIKVGKLIPEFRFPEFTNGAEWAEKTLGDFCHTISSGKDNNSINGKFELYGSTSIIGKSANASFRGDYILVARVGANAGFLNRVRGEFGVTDNTLVISLKKAGNIDFIFYSLEKTSLSRLVFGSGQPLITASQLKNLKLFIPISDEEQQKIASCLSSLDKVIGAQTQKLEALKEHKKGLMQNLFPKEGEMVPRQRFQEFLKERDWVEKNLDDFSVSISSGRDKMTSDGKFELNGSTGIIGKTNNASYNGDFILVARVGANAGLLNRVKGEFGVTDNTLVIELKQEENIGFIYYSLEKAKLNKLVFGSGQPLITGGQLKDLRILVPGSKDECKKIVDSLFSLENIITTHSQKIDQLRLHKNALLQRLFPSINR